MTMTRTALALCWLLSCALAFAPVAPRRPIRRLHAASAGDVVGLFGRLADKTFVVQPEKVVGTAASGYEFGILQAGRGKWLPAYESRSGLLQGGGSELTHVPIWRTLFDADSDAALAFDDFVAGIAALPYNPSMSAPSAPGAADPPGPEAVEALWQLLAGGSAPTTTAAQAAAAIDAASGGKQHLTWAGFREKIEGE